MRKWSLNCRSKDSNNLVITDNVKKEEKEGKGERGVERLGGGGGGVVCLELPF